MTSCKGRCTKVTSNAFDKCQSDSECQGGVCTCSKFTGEKFCADDKVTIDINIQRECKNEMKVTN